MKRQLKVALGAAALLALAGCQSANEQAMKVGVAPKSELNLRALETRRFATADDKAVLVATTQTLQDLGFTITESSAEVGLLSASKQRDAEEAGGVAKGILLGVLFGANAARWDKEQTIHVTLAVSPVANAKQIEVRAVFDRLRIDNRGAVAGADLITEQDIYQQFFDKLSAGVFLEAQKI